MPVWQLIRRVAPRPAAAFPPRFHKLILSGLRVRVAVEGTPAKGGVLYAANHLTWLDIPLLASLVDPTFVAKSDVRDIPLAGWLAETSGAVFVAREARREARVQAEVIAARLAAGENVVLFAEGTTGDGRTIAPFIPTLFAAATNATVQPVTIAYPRLGGLPVPLERLPEVAWIGETPVGEHAMTRALGETLDALVIFHPPIPAGTLNRKPLAAHARDVVAAGYAASANAAAAL